MPKTADCLKVPKKQGQKTIALAAKLGLMDTALGISRDDKFLFVPLLRQPTEVELAILKTQLDSYELASCSFEQKKQPSETLTQALQDKLPPDLLAKVPQAFDIIGDIVIIEIPAAIKEHQALIGEVILQTHPNIKVVLGKAGDISGVYRIRDYTIIAGEHRTNTVHREFGCVYHVDVAKAYFSPRLSHEHMRVAMQVQTGEIVADLFSGVGPFAVLIGKQCPAAKVYAVDLNPEAVELLKVNVRVNRVDNRVFPICTDAREIAKGKLKGIADHVIMNLPETAIEFVDAACNAIKLEGGVAHFYGFVRQPDSVENLEQRFAELVEQNGRKVKEFLCAKSIRETAPFESQIVLDAKIQ
ncbi:MAG TPA: class I SAM-dependent methyltransferase family protein [Candidatus Acidoferrales bacterium]|nr:class I SAM-dependent methyltransferase family protein [Candidatus Acidoferrales bacterium]